MDSGIGGVNSSPFHDRAKTSNEKGKACDLCKDWVSFIEYLIDEGFVYETIFSMLSKVSVV